MKDPIQEIQERWNKRYGILATYPIETTQKDIQNLLKLVKSYELEIEEYSYDVTQNGMNGLKRILEIKEKIFGSTDQGKE